MQRNGAAFARNSRAPIHTHTNAHALQGSMHERLISRVMIAMSDVKPIRVRPDSLMRETLRH